MTPLVLIHMLVGNTQHIEAKTSGPGAASTGGHTEDKIAIGVVIVVYGRSVGNLSTVKHPPQGRGNPLQLLLTAQISERLHNLQCSIIGRLELRIRATLFETAQILQLADSDRLERHFLQRNGFPQGGGQPAGSPVPQQRRE